MANTKISQLPQLLATGSTLTDVVAIVDSGNTTTSKITKSDFLNNGELVSDNAGNYNFFAAAGGPQNNATFGSKFEGSTSQSAIIAGNGLIDAGGSNIIFATIEDGANITQITNGASQMVIGGSFRSRIEGGERSVILGCESSVINNTYYGAILGSTNVNMFSGPSIVGGSAAITINSTRTGVIASESVTMNSKSSASIGSYLGTINGEFYQAAIGAYNFTFDVDEINGGAENLIHLGTRDSIVKHQRASMISTSGRTSLYSGTSHHDGIHIYQQLSTDTHDNGSGDSFTIDWDNAPFQKITMTDDTTIDFTNLRNGGVYKLLVVNDGTHSITGATASGYTFKCEGGTIPAITSNGEDLCILEVFGTDIYVRHFSNFATP